MEDQTTWNVWKNGVINYQAKSSDNDFLHEIYYSPDFITYECIRLNGEVTKFNIDGIEKDSNDFEQYIKLLNQKPEFSNDRIENLRDIIQESKNTLKVRDETLKFFIWGTMAETLFKGNILEIGAKEAIEL